MEKKQASVDHDVDKCGDEECGLCEAHSKEKERLRVKAILEQGWMDTRIIGISYAETFPKLCKDENCRCCRKYRI